MSYTELNRTKADSKWTWLRQKANSWSRTIKQKRPSQLYVRQGPKSRHNKIKPKFPGPAKSERESSARRASPENHVRLEELREPSAKQVGKPAQKKPKYYKQKQRKTYSSRRRCKWWARRAPPWLTAKITTQAAPDRSPADEEEPPVSICEELEQ